MNKTKQYILGWVVYYVMDGVAGDNKFYIEKSAKSIPHAHKHAIDHKETVIFKTQAKAILAAIDLQTGLTPGTPVFYREYLYVTHNPKNAKGLVEVPNDYKVKVIELD